MNNIILSIIIPNYNNAEKINRCINSILYQKSEKIEIIVVDDGSTDSSLKILKKYSDYITIIEEKNKGAGQARNTGLKAARGKYIWFVDSDDEIEKNSLNRKFILLLQKKNYDAYLFGMREIKPSGVTKVFVNKGNILLYKKDIKRNFINLFTRNTFNEQANKIYRRSFLVKYKINYCKQSVGEDLIFNCNVFQKLHTLMVLNDIKYIYYLFTSSDSTFNRSQNIILENYFKLKRLKNFFKIMSIRLNNGIMNRELINSLFSIEINWWLNPIQKKGLSHFVKYMNKKEIFILKKEIKFNGLKTYDCLKAFIVTHLCLAYIYLKLFIRKTK